MLDIVAIFNTNFKFSLKNPMLEEIRDFRKDRNRKLRLEKARNQKIQNIHNF